MGEYADYMINGDDCQECGVYISQGEGFPRTCSDCQSYNKRQAALPKADGGGKVACPICKRRVKPAGLKDHQRDAHRFGTIKGEKT